MTADLLKPVRDCVNAHKAAHTETLEWFPVSRGLPDDGETVLVHAPKATEPIWLGYYGDSGDTVGWHYVDNSEAPGVVAWARMPGGVAHG